MDITASGVAVPVTERGGNNEEAAAVKKEKREEEKEVQEKP